MGLALTAADARQIVASGRLAVFLGVESGFDHEGDPDVLRALYRLGLRVVQFSTQTCFNAFADAELDGPPVWNGINDRGRELVALMNSLGILIDITHATAQAQEQIIAASSAPVVASHTSLAAVSGTGMADDTLRALAAEGGMVGIIGASAAIGASYRTWLADHPAQAAAFMTPVLNMVSFSAPLARAARDHGEFGGWLDGELRSRHLAAFGPSCRMQAATRTSSPPSAGSLRKATSRRSPARTGSASSPSPRHRNRSPVGV
jgi:membrane dipeptidase